MKPKENYCIVNIQDNNIDNISFICSNCSRKCVYYTKNKHKSECKFLEKVNDYSGLYDPFIYYCTSKVAQVNALYLLKKKIEKLLELLIQ